MFDISPMLNQSFSTFATARNAGVTKESVTKLLLKYGNNPDDVKKMVDTAFADAIRMYPDATSSKIAEVIRTIY
jgi:hypothetical protein